MRHRRKCMLPAAVLLTLLACKGPADAYVEADRATFDVIAPTYLVYVDQDQTLDADQKDRRRRTVASWQTRLRAAEQSR